jgi:uncharacterized protein
MAARRPAEHANECRFAERRDLRHGLDGPFAELGRGDRSDAPEAFDRERVQERQLGVGGDHQQPVGLGDAARDLGEELRPGHAHGDGQPHLLEDLAPEPDGDLGGGAGDPPQPSDVEEGLVDRQPLDERRRVVEHLEERLAGFAVRVHPWANHDGLRAQPASERATHRRSDAERLRLVARREHDPGTDDHRAASQGGVVPLLDRGVEGVGVRVQDRRLVGHVRMLASGSDADRLRPVARDLPPRRSHLASWSERLPLGEEVGMEQRVSLITLGVRDLERARTFYEGLGWSAHDDDNDDVVFFQVGGMVVALWDRGSLAADSAVTDGGGWGGVTLAYNVRAPAEVDAVIEEARAAGARIGREPGETFWGGYSGVFVDPDGHPWEVAHNPGWTVNDDGSITL